MKKLLLTALIAAMLVFPLGTVAMADEETADLSPMVNTEYIPGSVPAETSAHAMIPALHAVMLAMENRDIVSFSTDDDAVSWEMLYNLLSMYGQMDERSVYEGEELVLPSETVMDYSAALFPAPLSSEELPAELADRMTYDAVTDEYRLFCGSDALSEVVITGIRVLDGSVAVSGKLMFLAEETALTSFTATLRVADNLFGYTLVGLNVI